MKAKPCPKCRRGELRYPIDKQEQRCTTCRLKARGIPLTWPFREVYRSECEEYYDTPGVRDDT